MSYINIYLLYADDIISNRFLSSLEWSGVSSLEVKHDIFGQGDDGTWQNPLAILTTKDR